MTNKSADNKLLDEIKYLKHCNEYLRNKIDELQTLVDNHNTSGCILNIKPNDGVGLAAVIKKALEDYYDTEFYDG